MVIRKMVIKISSQVKFKRGLKENLPSLSDGSTLYFTTDTNEIFRGIEGDSPQKIGDVIAGFIDLVDLQNKNPAIINKLYITNDNKIYIYDGSNYNEISGGFSGTISANNVIETSERQFLSAFKKAQIDANTQDISNHEQRIIDLENQDIVSTDEKVKLDVNDIPSYLADKLDNNTIQVENNKLVVKWIDGLLTTLQELNYLQGVTSNIQQQINNLSGVSGFRGVFNSLQDLENISDPQAGEYAIVSDGTSSAYYFYYGNSWDYSHETSAPVDIDINSTTGILPKSRYEKQNASETPITDSAGNFTATNVEDALAELFQYANSLKNGVASAIGNPLSSSDTSQQLIDKINGLKVLFANNLTQKGVIAYSYNTLQSLIEKVMFIPNVSIEGTTKQITKLNITAPYIYQIELTEPLSIEDVACTVLEYVGADSGVVHYQASYNNGESTSFDYNDRYVEFDGVMKLKEDYSYQMVEVEQLEDGNVYECEIDLDEFVDMKEFSIDENNLTFKAIPQPQVIKANGDIVIAGVDSLDQINLAQNLMGSGIANIAISFDSGLNYYAWKNGEWIKINVEDVEDFKNNGMTDIEVNALTNTELSQLRGDSNFIRFAYYLEKTDWNDVAENDLLEMIVTMIGYNVVADTSKYSYSYDANSKTLTFEFTNSGTYTFTYVDGQ